MAFSTQDDMFYKRKSKFHYCDSNTRYFCLIALSSKKMLRRGCVYDQNRQSLCCSYALSMDIYGASDKNLDL